MATEKITEQQILDSISEESSVLVIQADESGKEVLYETTFKTFANALKENGLLDDMQKASDFENLKPSIIKKVTVSSEKIVVEKLNGSLSEYTIEKTYPLIDRTEKTDSVFVTRTETVDGETVKSGARITLEDLVSVLKSIGINSGLMTNDEFTKQKVNIVKTVTLKDNVISVVLLSGRKYEYTIDTAFCDSASVDDEGYLHITKGGKDVIPAILIPALKEKTSEITCKNVGYVFEEET